MIKYKFISSESIEAIDYYSELSMIQQLYSDALAVNEVENDVIDAIRAKKKKTEKEQELLKKRLEIENDFSSRIDKLNEYKEKIVDIPSVLSSNCLDTSIPVYSEEGGKIIERYKILKNDITKISGKIERLKSELASSDFKVMKCMEANMIGVELPYDLNILVAERQSKRKEINDLESLTKI